MRDALRIFGFGIGQIDIVRKGGRKAFASGDLDGGDQRIAGSQLVGGEDDDELRACRAEPGNSFREIFSWGLHRVVARLREALAVLEWLATEFQRIRRNCCDSLGCADVI